MLQGKMRAVRTLAAVSRRAMSTGDNYIQETRIPTMHFQDSIPRLPIPVLKDTATRFLYAASPLISEAEMNETKKLMDDFLAGPGPALHKAIVDRDKSRYSSFISEPWFDMYLKNRDPLPLNINPQLTFDDDLNKTTQSVRAASMVRTIAKFYRTVTDGKLIPDMFHTQACMGGTGTGFFSFLNGKGGSKEFEMVCSMLPRSVAFYGAYLYGTYPLDMSQYNNLFMSTRVPGVGRDMLKKSSGSRHIIVQRGNDFWAVDILRKDGSVVPAGELESTFDYIAKQDPLPETVSLGVLTSQNRDVWAKDRMALVDNPANGASVEMIDSAIFSLCLEDDAPTDFIEAQNHFLFSKASNRWFDKSFQLIVNPNGRTALNFEHAWGDGVAVLRLVNEVHAASLAAPVPIRVQAQSAPRRVTFEYSAQIKAASERAAAEHAKVAQSTMTSGLEHPGFTSAYIKANNLGLDGCLQMCFQLAHYKLAGYTAPTYESANQSMYKHGRTETVRSATPESHLMCQVFADPKSSAAQKDAALRTAVKNHGRLTKEALMGKGWDRHVYALKHEAERQNLPIPAVFTGAAAKKLGEIILSTSTLSSPAIDGGGFGPVGPNCYAIGYTTGKLRGLDDPAIKGEDGLAASVMTYKANKNADDFTAALKQSLEEMTTVLDATRGK